MNYWLTVAEDKYVVQKSFTGNIVVKTPYSNYVLFSVDLIEHNDPITGMRHFFTKVVPFTSQLYLFQEEKDKALKAAKDFLGLP